MVASVLSIPASLLLAINISSVSPNIAKSSPGIWDPKPLSPAPVGLSPEVRTLGNLDGYVREQIHDGRESGELSHREARNFLLQVNASGFLAGNYGLDGFSDSELIELRSRLEALNSLIYVAAAKPLP